MRKRTPGRENETGGAAAAECCAGLGELMSPKLFRALCDPSRIGIVVQMGQEGRPMSVSDVAGCCPVSLSVVSRHLAQLRESGVVESRREGKQVMYSLRAAELARGLRMLADALEACCPPESDACGAGRCTPPAAPVAESAKGDATAPPAARTSRKKGRTR